MIDLNRISQSQTLIFIGTVLLFSLVGNIFLFQSNSASAQRNREQSEQIASLQKQLNENQQLKNEQLNRLDQFNDQQAEFADIVRQLRDELNKLRAQQQETAQTARQAQEQLTRARNRADDLDKKLQEKTAQLEQAQVTVNNQLRALRRLQSEDNEQNSDDLTADFAARLTGDYPNISITGSADGATLIHIPLELVFKNIALEFSEDAETILTSIADGLKTVPETRVQIIGHADSRPIISNPSQIYPSNWELSSARASRVTRFLISQGIAAERLLASGKAANQPVRDDANETAWALNRRIEIQVRP